MSGRLINQKNGINSNQRNDTEINQINGTEHDDDLRGSDEQVVRDEIYGQGGADSLFGGPGGDYINPGIDNYADVIWYKNFSERTDIIENFDPNDEDIVVLTSGFFWDLVHNQGLNSDANLGDWLKIELEIDQFGSHALIKVDRDGLQGNTPFRTLATLKNVDTNDLTIDIVDGDFIIG
ncbi:MAG: hypothetical protein F6J94_04640 [Moorea sp. SIO1F2]|uniref:hypothetical protein n=1 Tax=unclassified Moorena TaxID=2683338 RepID=UPI0013B6316C|nr:MULTISPECIES: hypothetical protein [unclassified Moorena]NEO20067.1 hypothetical protein [Moorena sp. SIO4A5]NEP24452.1 hypothetical protein [Moorena sp. SIO3I6]NEQ60825.1 hypothetical protein [Moorena sp. SIO4A1]NET81264.1 hypothetical protein [Moorena sp. SIO1F2]